MATNTLNDRVSGQTITESFFNDLNLAFQNDFVGRNTSGVAESGKNLGTAAFPWGTIRAGGLVIGGSSVDVSQIAAPPYRVLSGLVRSSSNQPAFMDAAGAAGGLSVTVEGASTNLNFDINGTTATLTTDIVKSGLSAAPAATNTALINDLDAVSGELTRTWGERNAEKEVITIDTIGASITALDQTYAAFENDTTGEIFYAFVDTTNNQLTKIFRGFFYDSAKTPINRGVLANNDQLTLLKVNYIFADNDLSTIDSSATTPVYDFTAPGSPATGDYWFDLGNIVWKRYDGVTFQTVTRTFIGWVVCDDTDALYARCEHFDRRFKEDLNLEVEKRTTEIIDVVRSKSMVNVDGNEIQYHESRPSWNITTDLAASADMYDATEQASRVYYCYIKDTGEEVISDVSPYFREDMESDMHPHNPWRAVAAVFNDSGSDFQATRGYSSSERVVTKILAADATADGEMTDLTTQIVPGFSYTYLLQGDLRLVGGDDQVNINIFVGATQIGNLLFLDKDNGLDKFLISSYTQSIFALSNTLRFDAGSTAGGGLINGSGSLLSTHVIVRESKTHRVVSDF